MWQTCQYLHNSHRHFSLAKASSPISSLSENDNENDIMIISLRLELSHSKWLSCLLVSDFVQNFHKFSTCRRYQVQKIWDQKGNTEKIHETKPGCQKEDYRQPEEQLLSWLFALWYKFNLLYCFVGCHKHTHLIQSSFFFLKWKMPMLMPQIHTSSR